MKSLILTLVAFCQLLLTAFVLYSTIASGLPAKQDVNHVQQTTSTSANSARLAQAPKARNLVPPASESVKDTQESPVVLLNKFPIVQHQQPAVVVKQSIPHERSASQSKHQQVQPAEHPKEAKLHQPTADEVSVAQPVVPVQSVKPEVEPEAKLTSKTEPKSAPQSDIQPKKSSIETAKVAHLPAEPVEKQEVARAKQVENKQSIVAQSSAVEPRAEAKQVVSSSSAPASVPIQAVTSYEKQARAPPIVKGGLGPLHLLATTLCSSQPDKPVADETLNSLYQQRAALRKSLFEFMSLKFTKLEKLSSRLNPASAYLEVMPRKTIDELPKYRVVSDGLTGKSSDLATSHITSVIPSHGWPVVGKCTAHDLRLMAEAAWCDEQSSPSLPVGAGDKLSPQQATSPSAKVSNAPVASSQPTSELAKAAQQERQMRRLNWPSFVPVDGVLDVVAANSETGSSAPIAESPQAAVISKILHVATQHEAPVVDSSIGNLNLTQHQLASLQEQATSTRECRRNALRLTKSLFNHLSEDQQSVSESWPKLYAGLLEDECARKRMIEVVTALSGFRGESTSSIRRDNLEFAFAMDDLRTKVLDNEVNVPLTFDKQFIEVAQFLQQSVRLMLANIDPEKAKLTSMRYRSLMPSQVAADDQCVELHQRLLAKAYPLDCNPNQFGQLPDVLRMAANSLELWSIESELNKYLSKPIGSLSSQAAYDQSALVTVGKMARQQYELNECIANLVSA